MKVKEEEITLEQFKRLNEDDLLFITFPGRMGDVYGCSFVIKENEKIKFYRIEDLYTFKGNIYEKFPNWDITLKKYSQKKDSDKYNIIYMGMGNLLGVNKKVYKRFETLLKEKKSEVEVIENYDEELKLGITCFKYWKEIVYKMFN